MSEKYDEYLRQHINAVRRALVWMLENLELPQFDEEYKEDARLNVQYHDGTKRCLDEYEAYDSYFYGDKDEDEFNYAWLRHIHRNPHHWQHWLLMNDDGKYRDPGKVIALEMPEEYVLEMIADWWSFSWRSGNLREVFGWYESHKDKMILHPNTRELVESVLGEIRDALDKEGICQSSS